MEKIFVVKRVAKKLFATEAAVDDAFAQTAELMSEMLQARKDVNASVLFADGAQAKLMEAMQAMSEARSAMVDLHIKLKDAQLRLGVRPSMTVEFPTATQATVEEAEQLTMRDVG